MHPDFVDSIPEKGPLPKAERQVGLSNTVLWINQNTPQPLISMTVEMVFHCSLVTWWNNVLIFNPLPWGNIQFLSG